MVVVVVVGAAAFVGVAVAGDAVAVAFAEDVVGAVDLAVVVVGDSEEVVEDSIGPVVARSLDGTTW